MNTEEMLFTKLAMLENELMITKARILVVEQLLEKALATLKTSAPENKTNE